MNGKLKFLFNNRDENLAVTVHSPAELCAGCWFRVIANRFVIYAIVNHVNIHDCKLRDVVF